MQEIETAIFEKAAASAFLTAIGGRFYDTEAPQGAVFPYCVYKMVIDTKEWQFVERFEDILLQFSIFSTTRSSTEANDIYKKLNAVYDESVVTPVGYRSIWMWRNNLTIIKDEITTLKGTVGAWHYAVDYNYFIEDV